MVRSISRAPAVRRYVLGLGFQPVRRPPTPRVRPRSRRRGRARDRGRLGVGIHRDPRRRRGHLGGRAFARPAPHRKPHPGRDRRDPARAVPRTPRPARHRAVRPALVRHLQRRPERGRAARGCRHRGDAREHRPAPDRPARRRAPPRGISALAAGGLGGCVRGGRGDRHRDLEGRARCRGRGCALPRGRPRVRRRGCLTEAGAGACVPAPR